MQSLFLWVSHVGGQNLYLAIICAAFLSLNICCEYPYILSLKLYPCTACFVSSLWHVTLSWKSWKARVNACNVVICFKLCILHLFSLPPGVCKITTDSFIIQTTLWSARYLGSKATPALFSINTSCPIFRSVALSYLKSSSPSPRSFCVQNVMECFCVNFP